MNNLADEDINKCMSGGPCLASRIDEVEDRTRQRSHRILTQLIQSSAKTVCPNFNDEEIMKELNTLCNPSMSIQQKVGNEIMSLVAEPDGKVREKLQLLSIVRGHAMKKQANKIFTELKPGGFQVRSDRSWKDASFHRKLVSWTLSTWRQ